MILTKILFIVLIIVCALFYILYLGNFALVLFIAMLILPIIMFVTTYIAKKNITVDFALKDKTVTKNSNFSVQLVVTNRSIFPIGKAEAHIEYYNTFNEEFSSFDLYLPIQPKNSQRITFQLCSEFCGTLRVNATYLNVFDPLRIFKLKAAQNVSTELLVLPECHEITGIVHYTDRVNEESDMFSEHRPGDDPSEVFDLREYYPGDKLNRIHWKLSSKKDEFIVKDYSLPIDVPCTLFLDLKSYSSKYISLPVLDSLIEAFMSVSQFLIENERGHSVILFDTSKNMFTEHHIATSLDLGIVVKSLLSSFSSDLSCQSPDNYFIDHPNLSYASFTYIGSALNQDALHYIDEEIDSEQKNAIIVIESADNLPDINIDLSTFSIIPVASGRISASIKDIDI
ncbi:DUF58 domain-containing protein [Ruminococcus sp.]|uniref:DUF58 domain-containing protein n=1 Tax=Ruminococcus sp. TaxID=41978 RepID=UPI001B713323|nr:DUF58 domain-containing protein [Ruminococcus sp.]MBP5432811.1 DUF58 domain-containing protein [Ruminococcus sp.]